MHSSLCTCASARVCTCQPAITTLCVICDQQSVPYRLAEADSAVLRRLANSLRQILEGLAVVQLDTVNLACGWV